MLQVAFRALTPLSRQEEEFLASKNAWYLSQRGRKKPRETWKSGT